MKKVMLIEFPDCDENTNYRLTRLKDVETGLFIMVPITPSTEAFGLSAFESGTALRKALAEQS